MLGRCRWRLEVGQGLCRIGAFGDAFQYARRRGGSGTRKQLDDPEARDAVARIFGPAQERQHVLDVGGFQKFQSAEFDKRDVAAGQLHFQLARVVRGAEQDGLRFQLKPLFTAFQHFLDDVERLIRLVAHTDYLWALGGFSLRPQIFAETLLGQVDDGVGRRQDRLRRAIICSSVTISAGGLKCPGKSRMLRTVAARNE